MGDFGPQTTKILGVIFFENSPIKLSSSLKFLANLFF